MKIVQFREAIQIILFIVILTYIFASCNGTVKKSTSKNKAEIHKTLNDSKQIKEGKTILFKLILYTQNSFAHKDYLNKKILTFTKANKILLDTLQLKETQGRYQVALEEDVLFGYSIEDSVLDVSDVETSYSGRKVLIDSLYPDSVNVDLFKNFRLTCKKKSRQLSNKLGDSTFGYAIEITDRNTFKTPLIGLHLSEYHEQKLYLKCYGDINEDGLPDFIIENIFYENGSEENKQTLFLSTKQGDYFLSFPPAKY